MHGEQYIHGNVSTGPCQGQLTHWDRDKINAISQMTFWNAFVGMKMYDWLLDWSLFPFIQGAQS